MMTENRPPQDTTEELLDLVLAAFTQSSDFNGIPLSSLRHQIEKGEDDVRQHVGALVAEGKITLAFASTSENPHIKRLPDHPVDTQIALLGTEDLGGACAYPTAESIRRSVPIDHLNDRPFTQRLALAEAQLQPVFFDLDVLERYQRDPRFDFEFQDYSGRISIASPFYDSSDVHPRDKVLLKTFGIGYDPMRKRVVLSFLRYLSRLSPEHQQVWATHIVETECVPNSDYIRAIHYGHWPEFHSAYEAFLQERRELNELATLIGRPRFFTCDWQEKRPRGFHTMLRPTRQNYSDFIHLLDKLLSEDINRKFFAGDLELDRRVTRPDGRVEIHRPGTLMLMEEWLSKSYRTADGSDLATEVLKPMKDIRRLRQTPAHQIESDEYDDRFPREQDRLLGEATRALTKLRLILSSHPRAKGRYKPPEWLDSDTIVFY